jgi:hypothetical protein
MLTGIFIKLSFFSIVLASSTVHADVIKGIMIDELYAYSDFVAVVTITEGHFLGTYKSRIFDFDPSCGVLSKGKVEILLKDVDNNLENSEIILGDRGLIVGSRYLVFLTKSGYDALYSSNSRSIRTNMDVETEQNNECGDKLKLIQYRISHFNSAALPVINSTGLYIYNQWANQGDIVEISSPLIQIPDDIERKLDGDRSILLGTTKKLIKLQDIIQLFRGIPNDLNP